MLMRRAIPAFRLAAVWTLLGGLLAQAAAAQGPPRPPEDTGELTVQVIRLEHQPATEAMGLVLPLLSPRGDVTLRPATNSLVVRDTLAAIGRILPVLRSFDHPARPVRVRLWLVRGSQNTVSPVQPSDELPPAVTRQLRRHLPYALYEILAESSVQGMEGQRLAFELGSGYRLAFRLGTILDGRKLRLNQFELVQRSRQDGTERSLLRSNLNLWLGGTQVVALASPDETSRALLVILEAREGDAREGG